MTAPVAEFLNDQEILRVHHLAGLAAASRAIAAPSLMAHWFKDNQGKARQEPLSIHRRFFYSTSWSTGLVGVNVIPGEPSILSTKETHQH
jgi:hypothetical protein